MYRFIISSLVVLLSTCTFGQNDSIQKDATAYKHEYGLRVGGDLSKLVRSFVEDGYKGFEINADYRITKDLYVAGELGTEEKNTNTNYYDVDTSGSYFKAGLDYNFYENWFGMDNLMYGGLRVGVSSFKHNLNSFTIYQTDHYWEPFTQTESEEFSGLSALWTELMIGIKAEVINNVYVGLNAQLKISISDDTPENFENIYIPGFNKTYDSSGIGVGFGYNISYLIPLYKKEN